MSLFTVVRHRRSTKCLQNIANVAERSAQVYRSRYNEKEGKIGKIGRDMGDKSRPREPQAVTSYMCTAKPVTEGDAVSSGRDLIDKAAADRVAPTLIRKLENYRDYGASRKQCTATSSINRFAENVFSLLAD